MIKEISTVEEYNQLIASGVIPIDVRTPEEYNDAKIPNSITGFDWNNGEFHDKYDDFDPEKSYVFICRSGNRSMQACLFLQSQGIENVYNLKGGMNDWQGDRD
jgi:rhodanese-related sulfurtransferase